jgi:hypothetical protein
MKVLCKDCFYANGFVGEDKLCSCSDAPYTDYVLGEKKMYVLNRNGECQFFKTPVEAIKDFKERKHKE